MTTPTSAARRGGEGRAGREIGVDEETFPISRKSFQFRALKPIIKKYLLKRLSPPPMSVKISKGHLSSNCPLRQEADYAII